MNQHRAIANKIHNALEEKCHWAQAKWFEGVTAKEAKFECKTTWLLPPRTTLQYYEDGINLGQWNTIEVDYWPRYCRLIYYKILKNGKMTESDSAMSYSDPDLIEGLIEQIERCRV